MTQSKIHGRSTRVVAASLMAGCGVSAMWAGGCLSSSSDPTPPDASTFDSHVPVTDSGAIPVVDSSVPFDANVPDVTVDSNVADTAVPPVDSGHDGGSDASDAADAGVGTVTTKPGLTLSSFRQNHSATLLANGKVLFCGGYYGSANSQASCDVFDPATTTMTAAAPMNVARQSHSATLLANGLVLFAGGNSGSDAGVLDAVGSAEIYDPAANTFTLVSHSLTLPRAGQGAVLMTVGANAGKVVLVAGNASGTAYDSGTPGDFSLDSAELFDPGADATQGTFTALSAHLSTRRGGYLTVAPLPGGGLLAAGGSYGQAGGPYVDLDTADTLDPALSAFTPTSNAMSAQRQGAQSVVLADGRVFIMAGSGSTGLATTVDIYDPVARTFSSVPLPAPRAYVGLALLKSGRVLIAGGSGSGYLGDILVFDPTSKTFVAATGTLTPPRALATATALQDGRVIIAGGQAQTGIVPAVDIFTE